MSIGKIAIMVLVKYPQWYPNVLNGTLFYDSCMMAVKDGRYQQNEKEGVHLLTPRRSPKFDAELVFGKQRRNCG
jgi:hypothetical protein